MLLLLIPTFMMSQNRYDRPAAAPIVNTYSPMSYEELYLRAAAQAWRERQRRENFEKCSQIAYKCLKDNQINNFVSYARAALNTGYYNSL